MLIEFEFSVSLISAEPRLLEAEADTCPRVRQAVNTASTTTPTSSCGTDHAFARSVAARTAPMLPATIRQSAASSTSTSRTASRRESSGRARLCASPKLRWTKRDAARGEG